jgi:hypothetical protein
MRSGFAALVSTALLLLLAGCARPVGDFGRAEPDVIHDDLMPAVGALRAQHAGEPVSDFNQSDEEVEMANRIWRFETSGDTADWLFDNVAELRRTRIIPPIDPGFPDDRYYNWLHGTAYQSATVRYATLSDDVEADLATLPDTFAAICKVQAIDKQRRLAAANVPTGPETRANLAARLAENAQQIGTFTAALRYRYDSYNYALNHLLVETPYPAARAVDRDLGALKLELQVAQASTYCGTGGASSGDAASSALAIQPRYDRSRKPDPSGPTVGS